ncbi:Uncharacterised protein [Salmonella enterica]|uniref:Uncharacterized protein n=1 Tax=Salmonella enterica TaxID=28901 RepID=A0A379QBH6_SALER|nr:hypothetical protein [Salmonella enterica subsp. salamae serovar Springs]SUF38186.1 Uncharacterised protein [Salmonella enterica]HCM1983650.1 hypothetical protein [Salmonella enterica subsp. salamae serovar 40:a:z39]
MAWYETEVDGEALFIRICSERELSADCQGMVIQKGDWPKDSGEWEFLSTATDFDDASNTAKANLKFLLGEQYTPSNGYGPYDYGFLDSDGFITPIEII